MNTRLRLEQLEGKDCPSPINVAIDSSGNMSVTGGAGGNATGANSQGGAGGNATINVGN